MPRAPKVTKPRHDPLHVELTADESVRRFGRITAPGKRQKRTEEEEEQGVSPMTPMSQCQSRLES